MSIKELVGGGTWQVKPQGREVVFRFWEGLVDESTDSMPVLVFAMPPSHAVEMARRLDAAAAQAAMA